MVSISKISLLRGLDVSGTSVLSDMSALVTKGLLEAIQQYMGFDLFAEDLGHGLDDVEPLPLFDPFKATFG